jgi:hypothetical protein
MKDNKNNLQKHLPKFLIITALIGGSIYYGYYKKTKLVTNWSYTKGQIHSYTTTKNVWYLDFTYDIKGQKYEGRYSGRAVAEVRKDMEFIKKYKFNVLYDSTDYYNSVLLLTKKDYEKYSIPYTNQFVIENY